MKRILGTALVLLGMGTPARANGDSSFADGAWMIALVLGTAVVGSLALAYVLRVLRRN